MSNDKKKFKDTKLGGLLKNLAPKILDVAGDLLPDAGVLSMVGKMIDSDPKISVEDKKVLHKQHAEMYKLEVADRDSARNREIEVAKTGKERLYDDINWNSWVDVICFYNICSGICTYCN